MQAPRTVSEDEQAAGEYLTLEQAARLYQVSKWTIQGMVQKRTVRHYRVGRSIRLRREDLDEAFHVERIKPT